MAFFGFCLLESVLIENVLKPRLMGSRMQMHSMLIFFAVLGGIASFGLVGSCRPVDRGLLPDRDRPLRAFLP